MGDYIPSAPIDDEVKKRNQNLPGLGGIFNTVNMHVYHYAGNNPVKYIDPNGEVVILVGMTGTGGAGTGVTGEAGLGISRDNNGNYQIGTYRTTTGVGFYAGVGASITLSVTVAPLAQELSDLDGYAETIGGALPIKGLSKIGGTGGVDINIPINGSKKNTSITGSIGVGKGVKKAEGHMLTVNTKTEKYAEGKSFNDVWNEAVEAGVIEGVGKDVLEQLKIFVNDTFGEIIP
jgi:hypothetical protein